EQTVGEIAPSTDVGLHERAPRIAVGAERGGGVIERTGEQRGGAVVERVREVDLRVRPLETVLGERERAEERRRRREGMYCGAHVVDYARKGELGGGRATAGPIARLDDEHRAAGACERHRRSEAVRSRTH